MILWIAVGETLARQGALPTDFSMLDLIEKYPSLKSSLAEALDKGECKKDRCQASETAGGKALQDLGRSRQL